MPYTMIKFKIPTKKLPMYIGGSRCTRPYTIQNTLRQPKRNHVSIERPTTFLSEKSLNTCGNNTNGVAIAMPYIK